MCTSFPIKYNEVLLTAHFLYQVFEKGHDGLKLRPSSVLQKHKGDRARQSQDVCTHRAVQLENKQASQITKGGHLQQEIVLVCKIIQPSPATDEY